jgi:hypothetical protein
MTGGRPAEAVDKAAAKTPAATRTQSPSWGSPAIFRICEHHDVIVNVHLVVQHPSAQTVVIIPSTFLSVQAVSSIS